MAARGPNPLLPVIPAQAGTQGLQRDTANAGLVWFVGRMEP